MRGNVQALFGGEGLVFLGNQDLASYPTPTDKKLPKGLKDHYFQTELELGRCLRLPQEGPCECDLYLSCAKFVTTPAYAPRLRRRLRTEQELIEAAKTHGWHREVERHQCTIRRLEQLLTDLGEPLDGPEATDYNGEQGANTAQ